MTTVSSPINTANQSVDQLVKTSGTAGFLKRGIAAKATTSGDTSSTAQVIGTHEDDTAFVAGDAVTAIAAMADETSPDSVDEGDIGALRMTLDRFLYVIAQARSGTATLANSAMTTASATIQASNALRRGLTVVNDSSAVLYIKCGSAASSSSFTVAVAASGYWECPFGYTGIVTGVLSTGSGTARVTEFAA